MDAYWALAPIIATFVIVVAMQAAVRCADASRKRGYSLQEGKTADVFAERFPLPDVAPPTPDRRKLLWTLIEPIHRGAIEAQASYLSSVVRAATCLVLAFCAFALATTPLRAFDRVELVFAWLDAIALALLIFHFVRGRAAIGRWIKLRVETELLRQYGFLAAVFPSMVSPAQPLDLTAQFEAEAAVVRAEVLADASSEDLTPRIERFWSARRASIENHPLSDADVTGDTVLNYLHRRPRRQLRWFAESRMRLERNAHRRSDWLLMLYSLALFLAVLKLGLVLAGVHEPGGPDATALWTALTVLSATLPAALLIITGLSASMTAYYINQNARSLIHRYTIQERRIEKWLETLDARWPIRQLTTAQLDAPRRSEIRSFILAFEDLMIEELVDWIHISIHDVIEIGP